MELNTQQQEIIQNTQGTKLVIAGPGTGKTTTISHYLAKILKEQKAAPQEILAVTFTVKAARELRERVYKLTGQTPVAGTIHAFALSLLRKNPPPGYNPDFRVLEPEEEYRFIRQALSRCNLKNHPQEAKEKLTLSRNTRERAELDASLPGFYLAYMKELQRANAMDFDALLTRAVHTLENTPDQAQYKYILVDEFQDTTRLQYDLIKPLAETSGNLLCVGDYDQSIYMFRGSDISIILNLQRDFPKLKTYFLEENYRCSQQIVAAANALIAHNSYRKQKPHWTKNPAREMVTLRRFPTAKDEAHSVAKTIATLKAQGHPLSEIAVLYRVHTHNLELVRTLAEAEIPYQVIGDKDFFDLPEIKAITNLFRLAASPGPQEAREAIAALTRMGARATRDSLAQLQPELKGSPLEIYHKILTLTGYIAHLEANQSQQGLKRLENVQELESFLTEFQDRPLQEFLDLTDLLHGDKDKDAVNLVTIHSAKGLEFDTVFIIGLDDGTLPHFLAKESGEIEEERRMLYVALTRARARLNLSYPKERTVQGKTIELKESRFINELDLTRANAYTAPKVIPIPFNPRKEQLKQEALTSKNQNPQGPWKDSTGNRWGICSACGEFTRDWWTLDGKTNSCHCNACKYK